MNVWEYLETKLNNSEKIHMTLIDPAKQEPERAGEMAHAAATAGTDAIMIGGSTGVSQELSDATIQNIKQNVDLPIILFPTSGSALKASVRRVRPRGRRSILISSARSNTECLLPEDWAWA